MNERNSFDLDLVEQGLSGTEFSGKVMHFPSVTSTSLLALEAAQSGASGGVYVADEQTAGRGRGDHKWHSSQLDGLYVSTLVTPPIPNEHGPLAPLGNRLGRTNCNQRNH